MFMVLKAASAQKYTHTSRHSQYVGWGAVGSPRVMVQALALFIPDPSSLYCLCPHQLVSTMQSSCEAMLGAGRINMEPDPHVCIYSRPDPK